MTQGSELDLFAPRCELKCAQALLEVLYRGTQGGEYDYLGGATQGVLKNPGQLGGAIWDELLFLVCQGGYHVAQGTQTRIDVLRLL